MKITIKAKKKPCFFIAVFLQFLIQKFAVLSLCSFYVLFVISCQTKEKSDPLDAEDGIRWKLVKYVQPFSGFEKELNPKNCEDCYTMWFDTDETVTALSVRRRMKLDLRNLNNPDLDLLNKMLTCERYDKDGEDYCDSDYFFKAFIATNSYSQTATEMTLFQHERFDIAGKVLSYLIFKRIAGKPPTTLRGTRWKLEGMADSQTGDLKTFEPFECEKCYMLEFLGDSIFNSRSIWATQVLDLSNLNTPLDPTKPWGFENEKPLYEEKWFGEPPAGDGTPYEDSYLYRCGIAYTKSYKISPEGLKLFFVYQEKKYYLLFKLVYK